MKASFAISFSLNGNLLLPFMRKLSCPFPARRMMALALADRIDAIIASFLSWMKVTLACPEQGQRASPESEKPLRMSSIMSSIGSLRLSSAVTNILSASLSLISEIIAPYGGIFKIMELFEHFGLGKLVDSSLGKRDASWNAFIRIMDRVKQTLGIIIKNFHADCGSFSKEIIEAVEPRCGHFYIRASNCSSRYEVFREFEGWESVEIDCQTCEFASFEYEMDESKYRLVVQRSPKKEDGKIVTDMFGTVYVYRAIITNDWKMSRLKKVLLHFICVLAKWVKSGRRNILKLYTERQYYKEIFSP